MMATSLGKEGYFQTKIIVPSIARDSILSDYFSAIVVGDTESREKGLLFPSTIIITLCHDHGKDQYQ